MQLSDTFSNRRIWSRRLFCLIIATIVLPSVASSETLFKENFDELPYENSKPILTGKNVLDHGQWETNPENGSRALLTQDFSLSEKQSLALGRESGIVANFGDTADNPVTESVKAQFSFYFTDSMTAEAYVYTKDMTLVAYAQIAANRPDAYICAWMEDKADGHRERIYPHTWYTVEFRLPAQPGQDAEYDLYVWQSDQPKPEAPIARGKFYHPPQEGTSYRMLTVINQNKEQQNPIFLDNYLIETVTD